MANTFLVKRSKPKILTGISIASPPTKTSYKAGETLNLSGMVVTATYNDSSTEDITSQCTFTPANGTVVYESTTKIDVTFAWKGAIYTTTQPITVTRVLSSIAVTTKPTKTSYNKGDTLNLSGMVVTATYNSGVTATVTGYTTSPSNGSTLSTIGTTTVTVSYTENSITKTASFTVSVSMKIVTWAGGTDAEIAEMVAAADRGEINLADYWAVGDERKVSLSAMSASGVGESHVAQTVTIVLMNVGGKTLASPTSSGRTTCSFIVGLKNSLREGGYMNSTDTNAGSWKNSARRTWCNNVFNNAISSELRSIFKPFINKTGKGGGSTSGTENTTDTFALPSEVEVFGSTTYSVAGEGSQFQWYKTETNRIKKYGDSGSAKEWWERSPLEGYVYNFCCVGHLGDAKASGSTADNYISPFGCI